MVSYKTMRNGFLFAALSLALCCAAATANTTSYWMQAGSDLFFKGKFNGTALTEDGRVALGYKMEKLVTSTEPYFWSMIYDSRGTLWAGSGNKAIIYKVEKDGAYQEHSVLPGVGISALAAGADDTFYAAVFPGGKIFSIDGKGRKELYARLPATYVWDMELDGDGNLFCVTGAGAGAFRIDKEKKVLPLYTSSEKHFLSMFLDGEGGLYVGTSPGGMIMKINIDEAVDQSSGKSPMLKLLNMGEIEELEGMGEDGESDDAGTEEDSETEDAGDTDDGSAQPDPRVKVLLDMEEAEAYRLLPLPGGDFLVAANQDQSPAAQANGQRPAALREPLSFPVAAPSPGENKQPPKPARLYRVTPEGRPRLLLEAPDPYILALHRTSENEVLIGTGEEGRIYILDLETEESLLQSIPGKYALAITGSGDDLKIATGNPGAIFEVSRDRLPKGVFTSSVNDAETTAAYGNLDAIAYVPLDAGLEFKTRTGNTPDPDDGTWSPWSAPRGGLPFKVESPPGRYIQYQAVMLPSESGDTPLLSEVRVYYLTDNRAPYITKIHVLPKPASRPMPKSADNGAAAAAKASGNSNVPENNLIVGSVSVSDEIIFRWVADDPDSDDLRFSIDFRRLPSRTWVQLEDEIYGADYRWETDSLPDGKYEIRLRVSDEDSNPPARALADEKISEPFIIDHTRPEVRIVSKTPIKEWNGPLDAYEIEAVITDPTSPITLIEYSMNDLEWHTVFPEDQILDSRSEKVVFEVENPGPGEHTLLLRARDFVGNTGSASAAIEGE